MAATIESGAGTDKSNRDEFMSVKDLQEYFGCGGNKAYLLMEALPSMKIGRRLYVRRSTLEDYLIEHNGVEYSWPRKKQRRTRRRS